MTEKRFRMETIGDVMLPFIVDNSTAKKKSDTITTYHTYETHRKEKCLELVDLLNDFSEENAQLKMENDSLKLLVQNWEALDEEKDKQLDKQNQALKKLKKENEELKIRNKGKQAFIDKQNKIIKLLYNQCKDFKEILDDSNITYPIDEKLNKFFEEGVKL